MKEERIDWIIHNASLLSANAERYLDEAVRTNSRGIENVLRVAMDSKLRVFAPSSIAAFGPKSPLDNVPDITIQRPTKIYGVTKVYLELLGEYYHAVHGVDFRSLRYPGIISNVAKAGGGTTDYAVEIYYRALEDGRYHCFLKEDTLLPMMYMPDCVDATIGLLTADRAKLKMCTYNVTAVSFTPREQAESIRKLMPKFKITYKPDFRQDCGQLAASIGRPFGPRALGLVA